MPLGERLHGADVAEVALRDMVIVERRVALQGIFEVFPGAEAVGGQHLGDAPVEASGVDSSGLVIIESAYDVPTTADRLEAAAAARGLTVFARIDHAAGATGAGMTLPPMELIIFGTAKVGTPLMQCDPTVGIDLPLKALIWRDENARVMLGYNSSASLAARHELGDCGPVLAKIDTALAALATEVTGTPEEASQK